MTTPYQRITAQRFLLQMTTGKTLVLSRILIPTITANLSGIRRQTYSKQSVCDTGANSENCLQGRGAHSSASEGPSEAMF